MDNTTENSSSNTTARIMWEIRKDGYAYFHNIKADNGLIAGWHINDDMIYNTKGTYLSASGKAQGIDGTYTISTNSLYASGGNIGGWMITPAGFSGGNTTLLNSGVLQLGRVTLQNERDGLLVSGAIIASGFVVGADHTTTKNYSLNNLYEDFKVTKYGSSGYTRIGYLDYLFNTWGTITPKQVWEGGYKATRISINSKNIQGRCQGKFENRTLNVTLHVPVTKILPVSNLNDSEQKTTIYCNISFNLNGAAEQFYQYGYKQGYWRGRNSR